MSTAIGAVLLALLLPPAVSGAQPRDTAAAAFVERARRATERFKDIEVAIAESYIRVGPDFPAMGEHWVSGELIMKAELDPTRPAILTYIPVDGRRILTGAVYALALRAGEQPPATFAGQWHDHVGTVDEESLLFGHDRMSGDDDLRLVVMHAWLWADNPAGMFATDNWTLPFLRIGLLPPSSATPSVARALSLVSADDFHRRLFVSAGELDAGETAAVEALLARHHAAAVAWWAQRDRAIPLSHPELDALAKRWEQLETDLFAAVGPAAAERLRRVLHPPPHHRPARQDSTGA